MLNKNHIYKAIFAAIFFSFIAVALTPFKFEPERVSENGANLGKQNSLEFPSAGIVHSRSTANILKAIQQENTFGLALRVRSYSMDQIGPARIFTISKNPSERNLTVAQQNTSLVVRLRTPLTTVNGAPELIFSNIFTDEKWIDIHISVNNQKTEIFVNNQSIYFATTKASPFASWNDTYGVALGNELTVNREWLGEISIARVSVKASEWNLLSYDKIYMPAIILRDFDFRWYLPKLKFYDLIFNFLGFLPFGFSLAMAMRHPKWIVAGIVCSFISLGVEFIQLFFSFRIPSISDFLTNTAGGFLGAFFASVWSAKRNRTSSAKN